MNELYLEYARVIRMCEGTNVKPWECIKFEHGKFDNHPEFTRLPPGEMKFAVTILEDKPAFVGDQVWSRITNRYIPIGPNDKALSDKCYSWHKPRRTFIFNGVELNCPVKDNITPHSFSTEYANFYFESVDDLHEFAKALTDFLTQARDKP